MKNPLAAILFVVAWPAVASAATAPIDEVLVSAKRRSADMREVSAAVSLLSENKLVPEKLLTDALAAESGVFLQQTTPGQGAAVIRGLKGSALLHLVDGMRLNNAIFRSAPTQYLALVPTSAVERIEIIRGTQTTLYGSDAIGGAIQLITRVPEFSSETTEFRGDAMLAADSAEQTRLVKVSVDAGNRSYAVSASGEYQRSGDRVVGGGEKIAPSGYDARAARLLFAATPSAQESWLFDVQFLEQPETPRIDELVPGFGQSLPSSSEYAFRPNSRSFVHLRRGRSAGLFGLDWRADLAWQQIVDDRVTRDYQSPERIREHNRSDLYAATLTAAGGSDALEWIAGAEFYADRVHSARSVTNLDTATRRHDAPRFPDESHLDQAAVFGRVETRLAERHLVSLGMRYSDIEVDIPASPDLPAARIPVDDISADVGWIFDVDESLQWVVNAGYGFRAPNIFDIGSLGSRPGNRFNIPNTDLDSEHVLQADAGIRLRKPDFYGELVVFAMRYEDRITPVLTGDVTPAGRDVVQSVNAARSSIHGVEAELAYAFSESLDARLVLNYTRGNESLPGSASEPADRIPPLNGRLQVGYRPGPRLALESWIVFADSQTRLSSRDMRDIRIDPDGTAGWGILGARLAWNPDDNWQLTAGVDNIQDKRYRMHGSGIDGVGRNFSLGIRRQWR